MDRNIHEKNINKPNQFVSGEVIKTQEEKLLEIKISKNSVVYLGSHTSVKILKEKDFQIELIEGQVRIKMDQQDSALINIGNKFKNASKGIKCITNTAYCTFCTL